MSNEITTELKKGFFITFVSQYSVVILQIILGVVLARLLTPSEFGVAAIILVFISFFQLISNSFSPGIIQIKELKDDDMINLFMLSILLAIFLVFCFLGLTFFIVRFYNDPIYYDLGRILSLGVFFCSLGIVPQSINKRKKLFKKIGFYQLLSVFISGTISIYLAYNGYSYYSVVIQSVINFFILFLLNFITCSELLLFNKYCFNWSRIIKSFDKISLYVKTNIGFDFVNFFSRNIDSLLVGKVLGTSNLALYDKAYRLVLYPVSNLNQVLVRVLHPVFSEYSHRIEVIYDNYKNVLVKLSIVGGVVSVFCYFTGESLIYLMYGRQWVNSIELFKLLSVTIWIQVIQASTGGIFLSTNNPKLYFYSGLVGSFLMISSIVIGVFIGNSLINLAYWVIFGMVCNFIQSLYFIFNSVFKKDVIEVVRIFKEGIVFSLLGIALFVFGALKFDSHFLQVIYNLFLLALLLVFAFRKTLLKYYR